MDRPVRLETWSGWELQVPDLAQAGVMVHADTPVCGCMCFTRQVEPQCSIEANSDFPGCETRRNYMH